MWISIRKIAEAAGKSARAIQIRMKQDPSIITRKKDRKSIEAFIPSMPEEWQAALVRSGEYKPESKALAPTAPATVPSRTLSGKELMSSLSILGKAPTEHDRQRMQIAQMLRDADSSGGRTKQYQAIAFRCGVSESTVRRVAKEIADYGVIGKPRTASGRPSFDPRAIAFLKGYYLQVLKETGTDSKKTAYRVLQKKAESEGWAIGGRSTAYSILSEISSLHLTFAREGNRGLDNLFYISRDCNALRPFQVIIGDQHIFDFWVADYASGLIKRPECYAWIDQGTKLVYGIAFAAKHYNSETVKEALRFGLYRHGPFENTYNDYTEEKTMTKGIGLCLQAMKLPDDCSA